METASKDEGFATGRGFGPASSRYQRTGDGGRIAIVNGGAKPAAPPQEPSFGCRR